MGNHCAAAYGEGKNCRGEKEGKKKNKKIGSAAPNISTETNCGGARPMRARFFQSGATNGRRSGCAGWPEDMAPP